MSMIVRGGTLRTYRITVPAGADGIRWPFENHSIHMQARNVGLNPIRIFQKDIDFDRDEHFYTLGPDGELTGPYEAPGLLLKAPGGESTLEVAVALRFV